MPYKMVKYRTKGGRFYSYAVVPALFFSDLVDWLRLSEQATIISTTDNHSEIKLVSEISDLSAPESWPSYQQCKGFLLFSEMLRCR
jgi:hypothetical protein